MAKSKTYRSTAEGPVTVYVPDSGKTIRLEPGESYETDDAIEITSLSQNPDLDSSGRKSESKSEERSKGR